jgi:DNA (cytosine-5)-methyltransferase 1
MKRRTLNIVDLFCGAGGSSTGVIEAVKLLGYDYRLTAVNHWNRAKETMELNHPKARVLCESVDSINPRELFKDNELDILIASPECTHFSVARGGRPVNEQCRATAMCVIRWAEALRPPVIMVENVKEFRGWGPLIRKRIKGKLEWVPDPDRKGELFHAWLAMLQATGYRLDHKVVNCADNGDPTTRERLFIEAIRGPRKICWPNPTHSEERCRRRRPWATARDDVIDWTLQGRWIDEMPGKKQYGGLPLSPNTLRRINKGFLKHGATPFIVPQPNEGKSRSVDRPLPTVTTTSRGVRLISPYIVKLRGTNNSADIKKPLPAVTGSGRNLYLAEPFIVNNKGKSNGASIRKPLPAQTSHAAHLYLAEPFIIPSHGERKGQRSRSHSITRPLPTVAATGHIALIEPAVLPQQSGGKLRSVSRPLPTISTKGAIALVEPYLIEYYGTANSRSIKKPLPSITTKHRFALVCPAIVIDGKKCRVRYRYRMIQWHELALGQGFRRGYLFAGNITEKIKMIGNAVPRRTMRNLILAAYGQRPDVVFYFKNEEELAA